MFLSFLLCQFLRAGGYYESRISNSFFSGDFVAWNNLREAERLHRERTNNPAKTNTSQLVQQELENIFTKKLPQSIEGEAQALKAWVTGRKDQQPLPDSLFHPETYGAPEPSNGWNIAGNLWQYYTYKKNPDPLLSETRENQTIPRQIVYDLRVLKLMLRLDHAKASNNPTLAKHYLSLIRQELDSNPITATMGIMKDWYAQNFNGFNEYNNLIGRGDWHTIGNRIDYPSLTKVCRGCNYVMRGMSFLIVLSTVAIITTAVTLPPQLNPNHTKLTAPRRLIQNRELYRAELNPNHAKKLTAPRRAMQTQGTLQTLAAALQYDPGFGTYAFRAVNPEADPTVSPCQVAKRVLAQAAAAIGNALKALKQSRSQTHVVCKGRIGQGSNPANVTFTSPVVCADDPTSSIGKEPSDPNSCPLTRVGIKKPGPVQPGDVVVWYYGRNTELLSQAYQAPTIPAPHPPSSTTELITPPPSTKQPTTPPTVKPKVETGTGTGTEEMSGTGSSSKEMTNTKTESRSPSVSQQTASRSSSHKKTVTKSHPLPPYPVGNCTRYDWEVANNPDARGLLNGVPCNATSLRLVDPNMTPTQFMATIPALLQMTNLTSFNLNDALLIGNTEIIAAIPVIKQQAQLQKLEFAATLLDDIGVNALVPILPQLKEIRRLNFRATKITDAGALALLPALKQLSKLTVLILSQLSPKLNTTTQAAFNTALPGIVDMS